MSSMYTCTIYITGRLCRHLNLNVARRKNDVRYVTRHAFRCFESEWERPDWQNFFFQFLFVVLCTFFQYL